MSNEQDPFAVLGLSSDASLEDIKRAYRDLARELHPDQRQNHDASDDAARAAQLIEVNDAYEKLTNPDKRKKYDQGRADEPADEETDGRLKDLRDERAPSDADAQVFGERLRGQESGSDRRRTAAPPRSAEGSIGSRGRIPHQPPPAWEPAVSWTPFASPPRPTPPVASPPPSPRVAATSEPAGTWHDVSESLPIYLGILFLCSLPALIMGPLGLIGAANHHHPIAGVLVPVFGLGFLIGIFVAFWATLWFFAQVWDALRGS